MAYVNVAEWKPDQVTEWLKGLDSSILPYLKLFSNNQTNGQQLLNVRSEDLDNLGVKRLGHQELILEAVEHLRNFHYELDRENLQLLALRLSCQAHSLHNELCRHTDSQPVSTQTLADVASVVRAVKPLVCWLDRSPFSGQLEYADRKTDLLKYSLEIATCAQRDRFAERPVEEIRTSCGKLAAIADGIIQDIADPLILQPASLDLATLRKRGGDDLGFFILPSFHGVHQIGEIKFGSPAHQCGKVEEGDEVVQVNYQTVVGWQRKKVVALFEESLTDVFLTLKKRPRHTKVYGQIYMKPYRLPSKKRAPAYTRWHDNLPSPRPELIIIPSFDIRPPRSVPQTPPSITLEPSTITSTSSESDDVGSGCDEVSIDSELEGQASPTSMRLYLPKPRVPVQRRATITGASPTSHLPPVDLEKFWKELKLEKKWKFGGKTPVSHNSNPECRVLRNKSPCEQNERPSTCLGFEKSSSKEFIKTVDYVVKSDEHLKEEQVLKGNSENISNDSKVSPEEGKDCSAADALIENEDSSTPHLQEQKSEKRFITRIDLMVDPHDSRIEFTEVQHNNLEVSRLAAGDCPDSPYSESDSPRPSEKSRKISSESELGDLPIHRERGRLDKSFSTPAYDLSGLEGLEKNPTGQKSPSVKISPKIFNKVTIVKTAIASDILTDSCAMPDITSSTPSNKRTQDYTDNLIFKFPVPSVLPSQSHPTDGETIKDQKEREVGESCDLNSNPVLHGRIVETINRHLLNSNCGKDGDDDCDDVCDISRLNPGLSRTMTNFVLNSPDLISDISSRRLYPTPDDDFDNGNSFSSQLSPRLDNFGNSSGSHFDFNLNSPHTKLPPKQLNSSPASTEQSFKINDLIHVQTTAEVPVSKLFRGDYKKAPPTPPARHHSSENPDLSPSANQHPKIPIKISVNPPEPPPRPNPPNRSPSIPSEQHKSSLRAMISSKTGSQKTFGSPKVTRKKNPLLAKRRSVSVKELGIADYQGWLYRRLRVGDSVAQWIKGWFILKGTTFYGFKSREAHKADCFISLPGFTISPAEEVKSKKYAFKVYHTGTVFYFASESDEDLAAWMDCLSMATFALDVSALKTSASEGAVFSETEDEGDEPDVADSCFPSPKMRKLTNFLSGHSSSHSSNASGPAASPKPARSHQNLATSGESKTYDIQKKFGSLKKLGYRSKYSNQLSSQSLSSATSLSGSEQSQDVPSVSAPHSLDRKYLRFLSSSKSQNVPVPTAQFRSYRRVVATEHSPILSGTPKPVDVSGSVKSDGTFVDSASTTGERFPSNVRSLINSYGDHDSRRNRNVGQRGDELAGLLTLEQFMLQRQEEERHQNQLSQASQHQDRFRERDQERDTVTPNHREANEGEGYTEDPVQSLHKSLEKRRTPPPAPLLLPPSHQQSMARPIPAARTILSTSGVIGEGSCEPPAIAPRTTKPSNDSQEHRESSVGVKATSDLMSEAQRRSLLAPKQPRLKNAAMYQPPPVAFSPPPNFGPSFEMHLDNQTAAVSSHDILESSCSRGTGSKIRQFLSPKRGHYQPSYSQVTPSSQPEIASQISHRTILGSPRLHRALFRQGDVRNQKSVQQTDHVEKSVFSPTIFGSTVPSASSSPISSPDWSTDCPPSLSPKPTMGVAMLGKKPMVSLTNVNNLSAMSPPLSPPQTPLSPPPDYPGLEYPPVFEPGIYSLSDTSTLLSQSPSLYSPSSDTSSPQSQR